ncbi:hypothetical protein KI688_000764 [Linnemannia hyalina]|uniref:F-box domain-containing protein n=1 Tax=Linnemannia hyalina TaxID=64524 RepID=A0A9P8BYX9_9FUNG|nr:hypothetical protein KI688_000764 [Linnemannia hyalina]
MARTQRNPLDVSEILLRVGYHLPLWKLVPQQPPPQRRPRYYQHHHQQQNEPITYAYIFYPQDLRSCLQVSKHWHQVLLPFLWEIYTYPAMFNVPSTRINRIGHHIRTFRLQDDAFDPGLTGLEYVNQLKELDIPQQSWNQYEFENAFGVQVQKRLVRTNGEGLKALAWYGYGIAFQPAYFDVDDFVRLKHVTFLRLDSWFGGEGLLARVLDCVAGTVEVLQLHQILDVLPGAFNLDDQADDAMSLWTTMTSDEPRGPRRLRRLVMPKVKTLKLTVEGKRNEGLVELVACCPNLQRLSFTPHGKADIVRVAEDIEKCGLRSVHSLTVKNEARNLDGVQCATLLQSILEASKEPTSSIKTTHATGQACRGLKKININPETLENEPRLVSRIVLHADTLRSLKLTIRSNSEVMSDNFLPQILYQCHNLEAFSVKVERVRFDLFKALGSSSGPWACRRLRKFLFSAVEFPIPELEKGEEDDEEEEGGVDVSSVGRNWFRKLKNMTNRSTNNALDVLANLKSISSTQPAMGWYKHTSATTQLGFQSQAFETMLLRRAFRMLNSQNLKQLEVLVWNGVPYERSKVPRWMLKTRTAVGDHRP